MFQVGDRIEMTSMRDDPDPIPIGTQGVVTFVNPVNLGGHFIQYGIKWDSGRSLMLCVPPDSARKIS